MGQFKTTRDIINDVNICSTTKKKKKLALKRGGCKEAILFPSKSDQPMFVIYCSACCIFESLSPDSTNLLQKNRPSLICF